MCPCPRSRTSLRSLTVTLTCSQRIWGHFLFVIHPEGPPAVFNNPGSPLLICCASITSSPKASGSYQSDFKRVYLQIIRSSGDELLLGPGASVPRRGVRGAALPSPCLMVSTVARCFKERLQMCDCSQGPNLFRGGGSDPDLFHPAAQRRGFLQEARCKTEH